MRILTLVEHQRVWPGEQTGWSDERGRAELSAQDWAKLQTFDERHARGKESAQLFTWGSRHVTARSIVGVVQVGELCVEVLPKVEAREDAESASRQRRNLLVMLMLAGKIKMMPREVAAQFFARAPLSEAIALIFAQDLREQLMLGPSQGYIKREEQRATLKGKIQWSAHIRHNAARRDRFFVRHEELVVDTALNRLLLGVCRLLLKTLRARACQDMLGQCAAMLEGVTEQEPTWEAASHIALNRQNARFSAALETCKMILAQRGPAARAGAHDALSMVFEMNQLYEQFIAGLLRRKVLPLLGAKYQLHTQGAAQTTYLLTERGGEQDATRSARLKPDIYVSGPNGHRVVLDTKWKRLRSDAARDGVSVADLYQMSAYGHCLDAQQIILLYPLPPDDAVRERDYESSVQMTTGEPVWIYTRFIDLREDLSRREVQDRIAAKLESLLRADEREEGEEDEEVEEASETIRRNAPRLIGMLSQFERIAPAGFTVPRQRRKHFRRIIKQEWQGHFLYSGALFGDRDWIELAVRADLKMRSSLRAIALRRFEALRVALGEVAGTPLYLISHNNWSRFFLAIKLPLTMSDEELARALVALIEATSAMVEELLRAAGLNPRAALPTGPS
jgi:5-methylcytosine-specific restriction enzyme subunit McrC